MIGFFNDGFYASIKYQMCKIYKVQFFFTSLNLYIYLQSEKECPYYMRTGSCKYSTNCRFHHPDPTAVASQGENHDSNSKKNNYHGTFKEKALPTTQAHQAVLVPPVPSWPKLGTTLKEPMQYVAPPPPSYGPGMVPPHGIFPNQGWNGYQVLVALFQTSRCMSVPNTQLTVES
jgi:Zinc finger C-x8-C-x5-C-x3-H type (and similar)